MYEFICQNTHVNMFAKLVVDSIPVSYWWVIWMICRKASQSGFRRPSFLSPWVASPSWLGDNPPVNRCYIVPVFLCHFMWSHVVIKGLKAQRSSLFRKLKYWVKFEFKVCSYRWKCFRWATSEGLMRCVEPLQAHFLHWQSEFKCPSWQTEVSITWTMALNNKISPK